MTVVGLQPEIKKKSLTISTVLTTDIILWSTKTRFRIDDFL